MDIFENGRKIGTLQAQPEGLYTLITCKTEPGKAIRRLYLACPYASQYLGIPDENGVLSRRIASKKVPKDFCAVAAAHANAQYLPWCGVLDGITVYDALISPTEILLSMEEAMNFPSWSFDTKTVNDRQMAVLPLSAEGTPLPREREATNEAFDFDDFDSGMSPELPADGFGGEPGADRPDL